MKIDRRAVLGALGTTAVGLATARAASPGPAGRAASGARVIDVHTHMFSRRWTEALKGANDPNVSVTTGPRGDAVRFRWSGIGTLGPEMYDWELRIREMDAAHVDVALISLTAPNVYWGSRQVSARAAREINEEFAGAARRYDGRIRWFASLPWDNADDALAELRHAQEAGAIGVCTLTNILGKPLTHERYRPIWREIEAMRLPVFIHPTLPFDDGMGLDQSALANAVGFTSETSLCFSRMMIEGFLDEFPQLELIACHGGGALPYLAPRMDRCWDKLVRQKQTREPPSHYLRRLWFDSVVYDRKTLEYLIECVGADRVLYGSDYPFSLGDMAGILARVDSLPPQQRDKVRSGNALRLFDL